MRELPRHLTVDELAELFEGRTALAERLAEVENPLASAASVIEQLSSRRSSRRSTPIPRSVPARASRHARQEQGADDDPAVLDELTELNRRYEERFGFRFVVFVNRRPKAEIVPVLRERLERSRDEELNTALAELVAIARDRWQRG